MLVALVVTTAIVCGCEAEHEMRCSSGSFEVHLHGPTIGLQAWVRIDQSEQWNNLAVDDEELSICVNNEYVVESYCAESLAGGGALEELRMTVEDGSDLLFGQDCLSPGSSQYPVSVAGKMVQAGTVSLGIQARSSATDNWLFDFGVDDKDYDLVASNVSTASPDVPRMEIRRGVRFSDGVSTVDINLAQAGSPLQQIVMVTQEADAMDRSEIETRLITQHGTYHIIGRESGNVGYVMSANNLELGEDQTARLTLVDGGFDRFAERSVGAAGTLSVDIMPKFSGVTFGVGVPPVVNWSNLPSSDYSYVRFVSTAAGGRYAVMMSMAWAEAHAPKSLSIDSHSPGFSMAPNFGPIRLQMVELVKEGRGGLGRTAYSESR
jgi:hypothetical protein